MGSLPDEVPHLGVAAVIRPDAVVVGSLLDAVAKQGAGLLVSLPDVAAA